MTTNPTSGMSLEKATEILNSALGIGGYCPFEHAEAWAIVRDHLSQRGQAVVPDGCDLIAAERIRQIHVEGWTPEHDAKYRGGVLAIAACCYAENAASNAGSREYFRSVSPTRWPWHADWWKPSDDDSNASRIRELTKAGALIAAEIDRLSASPSIDAQGKVSHD